ncbi:hypothetical protein HBH74_079000 [Parastagonospora nodorum]|nr:hypothetical protein HBH74_079000 [Parastagonospora nodorum]KAH4948380.1 hypothetical protein HBH73_125070 [Parastagonospora nodorum]KAH5111459.1 hypothetical protein HBH72_019120 [Parastagonospora nodorum]KAH5184626.1 hypothetical protein HBH76_137400 [Parastagonospora nodorum]KAH5459537.1 hypothetical protein HBI30_046640 [Parastagonospora nodorum]
MSQIDRVTEEVRTCLLENDELQPLYRHATAVCLNLEELHRNFHHGFQEYAWHLDNFARNEVESLVACAVRKNAWDLVRYIVEKYDTEREAIQTQENGFDEEVDAHVSHGNKPLGQGEVQEFLLRGEAFTTFCTRLRSLHQETGYPEATGKTIDDTKTVDKGASRRQGDSTTTPAMLNLGNTIKGESEPPRGFLSVARGIPKTMRTLTSSAMIAIGCLEPPLRPGLTRLRWQSFEMNYSSSSSFQRQDISDIAMKGGNSIVTSTDTLGVTIKDDSISATDDEEHAVPSDKTTGFRGYVWKINRLLDNFTCGTLVRLKSTEDPLQDGYVRLRWQCRCGEKFSGDVMEYREGGVARLIERMEQTTGARIERNPSATIERTIGAKIAVTPYKEAKATQRYTFRYPSWIQASAEKTSSALGYPTNSLLGLPQHGASGATTAYAPQAMGLQIPQQTLHLMACMQRGRYQRTVYQDRIDDITTDQALFSFMRKQVAQYRGKVRKIFSMKCIQGMYFVKFRLRAGGSAEVRNHEPCCTSSHPQICECIPPAMKVEPSPDAEYRCAPAGPLDNWPPVLSEELMHMLTSPQCINPKETFVLEQLPKRTRGELIGTIGRPAEGWGIHFQEGWDFDLLIGIVLAVFLLASLLFAVLWSHFKLDVQGAFGVSSYMVTASGIFVAWFANRAGKLG